MEERSVLQRLRDARGFARKAHELIGGMPLSMLKRVEYYEHAARSYLIIVGEALNRLPPETKDANPQIPWDAIRGMRNRLVHAYWRVDLDIVKRAVAEDLPELVSKLGARLSSRWHFRSESDSVLLHEQAFPPLEDRPGAASAAERAGLRAEGPSVAFHRGAGPGEPGPG